MVALVRIVHDAVLVIKYAKSINLDVPPSIVQIVNDDGIIDL